MRRMSRRAGRPVNWNVYVPAAEHAQAGRDALAVSDTAATEGSRVWALAYPGVIRSRYTLDRPAVMLDALPGWSKLASASLHDKMSALRNPLQRVELAAAAIPIYGEHYWDNTTVVGGTSDTTRAVEGRRLAQLVLERGGTSFDVLCDLALTDELRTAFAPPAPGDDEETWKIRLDSWTDKRVVLGASDAGAHLDLITTYDWAPALFAANRERQVLSLEETVRKVTSTQADAYGLSRRGRLVEGAIGDIVVFDPDHIGPGRTEWRDDLPAGAGRLYQEPIGIHDVIVAGTPVVHDGQMTGAAGGQVLRSGRDTTTTQG